LGGIKRLLGLPGGQVRKHLTPVGGLLIVPSILSESEKLGPPRHFPFNALIQTGKEFSDGLLIDCFVGQGRPKVGLTGKLFVPTDLGSSAHTAEAQKKRHLLLGKREAFPVGSQVIWKRGRRHEDGRNEPRMGSELQHMRLANNVADV